MASIDRRYDKSHDSSGARFCLALTAKIAASGQVPSGANRPVVCKVRERNCKDESANWAGRVYT